MIICLQQMSISLSGVKRCALAVVWFACPRSFAPAGNAGGTARATRRGGRSALRPPSGWSVSALLTSSLTRKNDNQNQFLLSLMFFAGLVAIAGSPHPIPFRTRP